MPTLLTTGTTTVTAGTTPDLTAELYDNDGSALLKASITSLTLTIKDSEGNVINSRDSVDINDTGIGSLEDVVVGGIDVVRLTIKPVAADTAYQATDRTIESHMWRIDWGWTDTDGDSRTAGKIYEVKVERMPTAAA